MVIFEKYNAFVGGLIATVSFILGERWPLFAVFLLLNILDYVTGVMKSRLAGKESSSAGLKGVIKKLGYWLMILLAFAAGYWFISMGKMLGIDLEVTKLIGWFVLASLTVNEFRSILENFVEAGFDVPQILVKGLEVADNAINKKAEEIDLPTTDNKEE